MRRHHLTLNLQIFLATTQQQQRNMSRLLVYMLQALVLLPFSTSCTVHIKRTRLTLFTKKNKILCRLRALSQKRPVLLDKRDLFCLTIHRSNQSLPPYSQPISLYFPFLLSCFVFVGLPAASALLPALLIALLLAGGELQLEDDGHVMSKTKIHVVSAARVPSNIATPT